ncbi:hypothetical protein CORC01_13326 [Colletotrichum orchidophilum]|uniref:C2H2-type domain-containing protein n=1 Tax=Colletotrichum orchidophilum TaxID=1209926 RepID=A0A1G4AQA6_9PEZI|nr:uncharacterized protein CORC01_13326 [Colletotrichum orchidophilum]OHE91349.1 hypothetical protein CORC01_13326 [Colletotrichum orchidophilum]
MGHKTVARSRTARLDATQGRNVVASSRSSVTAPSRVDEASRDLAYQFPFMNRASRRPPNVDHATEVSAMPSSCVPSERPLSWVLDSPQPRDRRHSSFESGNMPSLAYRVKPQQPHNPRKHQRGSPSMDSLEERPGSTARYCKRISGDSGYGSDTSRRRRGWSRDPSEHQEIRIGDVRIQVEKGGSIVLMRCSSPESDGEETLDVPRRPKRHLRRHSTAIFTATTNEKPQEAQVGGELATLKDTLETQKERQLDAEKERMSRSLPNSLKGLRRMKGSASLRTPGDVERPVASNIEALTVPGISSTNVPGVPQNEVLPQQKPSLIESPPIQRSSNFGNDLTRRAKNRFSLAEDKDGHPIFPSATRTPRPSLQLETSMESPVRFGRPVQPAPQRMPRPVSGPPKLPLNWHANLTSRQSFAPVEEQCDSASDSGDESSVESGVFSVPNSPVESCHLDQSDPLAPHMEDIVGNLFQRYQDWKIRERGVQGRRPSGQRVDSNTPDSGRSSRKRSHSDPPDQDASDGGESNAIPGFKKPKVPANPSKFMFACPFWKNDPDNHRQCYKKVLSQIKYVKSHLYRFHAAPITCPCCGAAFQDEETRDRHARARRCEVVNEGHIVHHEGLSQGRMRQVSKRANPSHSPEEQWFTIWDIVFPSRPRPSSPYIDGALSEDLCSMREFYTSVGTDMMLDYLAARDPDFANDERRAAMYDRAAFNQLQERIYETWMARRGLRQIHDPNISTTPPRTESDDASRASPANGISFRREEQLQNQQQRAQTTQQQQQGPLEDMMIQPVTPEMAVQFTGQDFGEADFGRDDMYYDTHTQALFDDLNGLLPGVGRTQYHPGGLGPPHMS